MEELYTKIENGIIKLGTEKNDKYTSRILIKFPNNFGYGVIMQVRGLRCKNFQQIKNVT